MGSGIELAKAYVQIIPSAEGIKGKISGVISGEAGSAGSSAGSILGKNLGSTLIKAVGALGLGQALKETLLKGADLQQNLGGVETLFKDHADTVIANAKKAYQTAGLSANDYMETVTSFSASLLQGLGGNTELAASMADRALIDMADNANKMGTSMESIQNAYQGFAKQNYTMLDNLKLGYGGTKEEMARLIAEASKMTDIQKELGITVDESSTSFDNIINAISVVQKNMGIANATADEAKGTFTGSFNAMKAAAENFMATLTTGQNVGASLFTLFETSATFIKGNLIPMVGEVLTSIGQLLWDYGAEMISGGSNALANFINGISEKLPDLIPKALEMIVTFSDAILNNFPVIVDAGIGLLKSLVKGIINGLPTLIVEAPRIINGFANAIYALMGELLATGIEMIVSLAKGIWQNRNLIIENAGEIFKAFLNIFSLSKLFKLGGSVITNIKNGIQNLASSPVTALKDIAKNAINSVKNMNWAELGKNVILGIVKGIKNNIGNIISALTAAAQGALDSVKKVLGIKSPSRVFRDQVGKMIDLGLAAGIEKNMGVVTNSMKDLSAATVSTIKTDFTVGATASYVTASHDSDYSLQTLYELLGFYLPQLANMKMVTDTGVLVGELAPGMDDALGRITARRERGN